MSIFNPVKYFRLFFDNENLNRVQAKIEELFLRVSKNFQKIDSGSEGKHFSYTGTVLGWQDRVLLKNGSSTEPILSFLTGLSSGLRHQGGGVWVLVALEKDRIKLDGTSTKVLTNSSTGNEDWIDFQDSAGSSLFKIRREATVTNLQAEKNLIIEADSDDDDSSSSVSVKVDGNEELLLEPDKVTAQGALIYGATATQAAASTTIDADGKSVVYFTASSGTLTITDILNGEEGQILKIVKSNTGSTLIVQHNGNIKNNFALDNYLPVNSVGTFTYIKEGSNWIIDKNHDYGGETIQSTGATANIDTNGIDTLFFTPTSGTLTITNFNNGRQRQRIKIVKTDASSDLIIQHTGAIKNALGKDNRLPPDTTGSFTYVKYSTFWVQDTTDVNTFLHCNGQDVTTGTYSSLVLTGSCIRCVNGAITIQGIVNIKANIVVHIFNNTGTTVTLANDSGSAGATTYRLINSSSGANLVLANDECASYIYLADRWRLLSTSQPGF